MASQPDLGPQTTTLRASDADRDRVAEKLRQHYAAGRLSEDDLSARLDTAYRGVTLAELEALVTDLPEDKPPAKRRPSALAASVRVHGTIYAVVNLMLIAIWAAAGGGYFWPIWPILGWGIGLGCHAAPLLAGVDQRRHRPRHVHGHRHRHRHGHGLCGSSPVEKVARAVETERPTLQTAAAPDGTVTILFSDIEGSTALNEKLGDLRWLELLERHNRIVREQVRECGGYEVKAQGDGFMLAFASARRAISCARAIQKAVHDELHDHPDGPIRVRIGLHTGEAISQDSDYYGKNVVVAARIAAQARGEEILASSVVKNLVESAGDVHFADEREVELPGLGGTHAVYRVV